MYIIQKKINNKKYYYLEEKINNKTISTFIGLKNINSLNEFKEIFKKHLLKVILEKIKTNKIKSKYLSNLQIIELEKLKYNLILFKKYFKESFLQYDDDEYLRYLQGSSSIEGNSINLQEAKLIINENLSISGKKIDEIKEIQNLNLTKKIIDKCPTINEKLIKKIHLIIMDSFENKKPGQFRQIPIYVTGSQVNRPNYKEINKKIKQLITWYDKNKLILHPVEVASIFHVWFENIHPFIDGNGRVGRELLNLMLLKEKYPRVIINLKNRLNYISILENLQINGFKDYIYFSEFIYQLLFERSKIIEKEIEDNLEIIFNKVKKINSDFY